MEREVGHTPTGQTVSIISGLGDRSFCNLDQRFHPIETAVISLRGPQTFILTTSENSYCVSSRLG